MNVRWLELADCQSTPSWQLGLLATFVGDTTVAAAVASNLNTPKWASSWLSRHKSPIVREAVAQKCGLGNRFLSQPARTRLLNDGHAQVKDRAVVASRNGFPPLWLQEDQPAATIFGR